MNSSKFLLLLTLLASCAVTPDKVDTSNLEAPEVVPNVLVSVADSGDVPTLLAVRGIVEPFRQISIQSRTSGFVRDHALIEGARVNKGEVLLQLDDREWHMGLEEAKITMEEKKQDFGVQIKVRKVADNDTEQRDILRIRTGLAQAEVNVEKAQLQIDFATIEAPFSGTISVEQRLNSGQFISTASELGQLVDQSKVRVRFDVLESELASLSPGQTVEIRTPSGQNVHGTVESVNPLVDQKTRVGKVSALFDNENGLLAGGMMVSGHIVVKSHFAKVRVPRTAILERDQRTLMFKISKGAAEWVYVTPEAINAHWAAVNLPNIGVGDTIAVDNHFAVSHLQKVNATMVK